MCQRRNDKGIMDKILRDYQIKIELIQTNACRIFLQINHLSTIILPYEKTINHNFLIGSKLD